MTSERKARVQPPKRFLTSSPEAAKASRGRNRIQPGENHRVDQLYVGRDQGDVRLRMKCASITATFLGTTDRLVAEKEYFFRTRVNCVFEGARDTALVVCSMS